MMDKICSDGFCNYRIQGPGTIGSICQYQGYCDYQRPKDSRVQPLEIKGIPCANRKETKRNAKEITAQKT